MPSDDRPVLVLGAGINGAAIARELALNGMAVCVVDTGDICGGTTAYSSRLIHGGLRYLEFGEFDLVRESLQERARLLRLAPHLVTPLRLCVPVRNRCGGITSAIPRFLGWPRLAPRQPAPRGLWLVRTGLWLYNRIAKTSGMSPPAVHRTDETGLPQVDANAFRWLCSYADAQARYTELLGIAMLEDGRQVAQDQGTWFRVLPYHQAHLRGSEVVIRPRQDDRDVHSKETDTHEIACTFHPAAIVNATGAWVDHTLRQLGIDAPRLIGGTKGSHLLLRSLPLRKRLAGQGVYVEAADGRPVFMLPLGDATLVGTTDIPFDDDPRQATASDEEVDYLLSAVDQVFPGLGLTRNDVDMHCCGVRPLPHTDGGSAASITRRHRLEQHPGAIVPFYSVIGGKLTTCRSLAEQAVGTVLSRLGRPATTSSRERPLPGSESYPSSESGVASAQQQLAQKLDMSDVQIRTVWALCGTRSEQILTSATLGGTAQRQITSQENLPGTTLPCSFARWVIRNQWVSHVEDLVERRLMLLYKTRLSQACLRRLAQLLVEENIYSPDQVEAAVGRCVERLRTHYGKRVT